MFIATDTLVKSQLVEGVVDGHGKAPELILADLDFKIFWDSMTPDTPIRGWSLDGSTSA